MTPTTPLAVVIDEAIKGRTIADVAREWGVPRWVLDDVRHGRIKTPGAAYLLAISQATGTDIEELLPSPEEPSRRNGGRRKTAGTASRNTS